MSYKSILPRHCTQLSWTDYSEMRKCAVLTLSSTICGLLMSHLSLNFLMNLLQMYMVKLAKFLDLCTFKKLIPKVYEIQSWYIILKQLFMKRRVHNLKGVEVNFCLLSFLTS